MVWIIIVLAVIILFLIIDCAFENSHFKAVRYVIDDKGKIHGKKPRFIFLSDLHGKQYGKNNEKLLKALNYYEPDFIVIGGDMIIGSDPSINTTVLNTLREISKVAKTYYAFGNHETKQKEENKELFEKYIKQVRSYGITVLSGNAECIPDGFEDIHFYGLELPKYVYHKSTRKFNVVKYMEQYPEVRKEDKFNILLAHDPYFFGQYKECGPDLVLSGHVHGGIVRIPFIGGVISPRFHLFPKYDRGRYKSDNTEIIISGGIGNHHMPIRINNLPEMLIIEFKTQ